MFMHMLGYPTHFGQMETLKLIASSGFPDKVKKINTATFAPFVSWLHLELDPYLDTLLNLLEISLNACSVLDTWA